MYCPICGSKNVKLSSDYMAEGKITEGGIYVAKSVEEKTEFYDDAYPFECVECGQIFYLGFKVYEEKLNNN